MDLARIQSPEPQHKNIPSPSRFSAASRSRSMNRFARRVTARSLERAVSAFDRLYDAVRIPVHQRIAIFFKSRRNIGFGPAPGENADDPLTEFIGFTNLPVYPRSLVRFFADQNNYR